MMAGRHAVLAPPRKTREEVLLSECCARLARSFEEARCTSLATKIATLKLISILSTSLANNEPFPSQDAVEAAVKQYIDGAKVFAKQIVDSRVGKACDTECMACESCFAHRLATRSLATLAFSMAMRVAGSARLRESRRDIMEDLLRQSFAFDGNVSALEPAARMATRLVLGDFAVLKELTHVQWHDVLQHALAYTSKLANGSAEVAQAVYGDLDETIRCMSLRGFSTSKIVDASDVVAVVSTRVLSPQSAGGLGDARKRLEVVIAFRGTSVWRDWVRVNFWLLPGRRLTDNVVAHPGFAARFERMRPRIDEIVSAAASAHGVSRDFIEFRIAGHSLGAALASLAAWHCERAYQPLQATQLFTFADPGAFYRPSPNSSVQQFAIRHAYDPVAWLPSKVLFLQPLSATPTALCFRPRCTVLWCSHSQRDYLERTQSLAYVCSGKFGNASERSRRLHELRTLLYL
mmetsp:Transcript_30787/g.75175  ORF Transcript_30787/g.75175 Transcript_30787/m.75175 type:complete len:463 (+) Transcript_30787:3-1391(+)